MPGPAPSFWAKVRVLDGLNSCWEWVGKLMPNGYGQIQRPTGKYWLAHRYAYTLVHGEIPEGLMVLHSCDNRKCVNPTHLRAGTAKDNTRDMFLRGRSDNSNRRGAKHFKAVFTDEDVLNIRRSSLGATAISRIYGVTEQCIYAIKRGASWKHLPLHPEQEAA